MLKPLIVLCLTACSVVLAQQALYDPEPPADSVYVRLVHAAAKAPTVGLKADGTTRVAKLGFGEASDYMILKAGKHDLQLFDAKNASLNAFTLNFVAKKFYTLAWLTPEGKPTVFEDNANTNKIKALLVAYHLAPQTGPLDVLTADGKNKVFAGLESGTSKSIQVNPVRADVMLSNANSTTVLAKAKLDLANGATYSLFVFGLDKGLKTVVLQNKSERFTGK